MDLPKLLLWNNWFKRDWEFKEDRTIEFFYFLNENFSLLLQKTLEHINLVATSLLFASAIAVPLGILIGRFPAIRILLLKAGSVSQTIPSLAMLALLDL